MKAVFSQRRLVGGAAFAWHRRWPVTGFAGFAFFLLLAPSSSIVPVATQTMAEILKFRTQRFGIPGLAEIGSPLRQNPRWLRLWTWTRVLARGCAIRCGSLSMLVVVGWTDFHPWGESTSCSYASWDPASLADFGDGDDARSRGPAGLAQQFLDALHSR